MKRSSEASLHKEIALIATYVTALILYWLFEGYDFTLSGLGRLYISQATLDGIDIGKRVNLFYLATFSGLVILPLLYYAGSRLSNRFALNRKALQAPAVLATTGLVLLAADILGIASVQGIKLVQILFVLSLFLFWLGRQKGPLRILGKPQFYAGIILCTVPLFSAVMLMFNSSPAVARNNALVFVVLAFALGLAVYAARKLSGRSARHIFSYALPFSLIPIFIFIAIEAQFYSKMVHGHFIAYKWLFMGLCAGSFILFATYNTLRPVKLSVGKLLSGFMGPSAVLCLVLFSMYTPVQQQPTELFELANPANAMMRIFALHEIPLVDFMSSHMLSEEFYGVIHNLVYGYNGSLDFLSYHFMYFALFYLIAYFFSLRLLKSAVLATLLLFTFPLVFSLFHPHLFYGILALFIINKLIQRQQISWYLALFITISMLIAWRLDTGIATLMGAVAYIPLAFYARRTKLKPAPLLKAGVVFALCLGVLVALAAWLRTPEYLFNHFRIALHYVSANQAHGRSVIVNNFDQHAFFFHILMPMVAVCGIVYLVYAQRRQQPVTSLNYRFLSSAAIFLYLIYLANFPRGLVRHGFAEGTDAFISGTFYLATTLLLLSLFSIRTRYGMFAGTMGLGLLLVISIKYFPISPEMSNADKFLRRQTTSDLDNYFSDEHFKGKILPAAGFAEDQYTGLKTFLDHNLSADQTFLDFSNTPMLYYYCQRRVPSYFCQNLQNSVDDYLVLQHLSQVDTADVPVVVFNHYPLDFFEATDGVPNTMRQYLMAEYIYKNYKPYGLLGRNSVWVSKSLDLPSAAKQDEQLLKPQKHEYRKAAFFIYQYFTRVKPEVLEQLNNLELSPQIPFTSIAIDSSVSRLPGVLLQLDLDTPPVTETTQEVRTYSNGHHSGTYTFNTIAQQQHYMIRLSNQYLWSARPPDELRIYTNEKNKVSRITFYKDLRNEHPAADLY